MPKGRQRLALTLLVAIVAAAALMLTRASKPRPQTKAQDSHHATSMARASAIPKKRAPESEKPGANAEATIGSAENRQPDNSAEVEAYLQSDTFKRRVMALRAMRRDRTQKEAAHA